MNAQSRKIHNLVLIRYNMAPPTEWHNGTSYNLDNKWLERRHELFKRYCLPSLQRQRQEFIALMYFDERTPVDYINSICSEHFIQPILTSQHATTSEAMLEEVVRGIGAWTGKMQEIDALHAGDIVSTTRLDNDDAISPDYLQLANDAHLESGCPDEEYVYFPTGQEFTVSDGNYYIRNHPNNAFGTLYERWKGHALRTVMHCQHSQLLKEHAHNSTPLEFGTPHWCMIIHENNVSNRVRGKHAEQGYFPIQDHATNQTGDSP